MATIAKGCQGACPACYAGGDCVAAAASQVASTEAVLDLFGSFIYCSTGGNANQNHCRERVLDALTTLGKRQANCYRKCFADAQRGDIPAAACAPPVPTDLPTSACVDKEVVRAMTAIDNGCSRPRAEAPPCYGTSTGASWVSLAQPAFDSMVPVIFCGSPSGAFLR